MGKISQLGVAGPPQNATDVLTEILRAGSHELLAAALEVEINGYHRPREVQTGIGSIWVKAPRVRDQEPSQGPIKFTS